MSRIRSVHPGLFTDEGFVSVSDASQIFVIGLWTEADDQGVFEWKPLTLKMRLRAASSQPVEPLLEELLNANCIAKFSIDGRHYGAVRNFRRFQRPKSPNSIHPCPQNIRKYVGLDAVNSETDDHEKDPFPQKGEIDRDNVSQFPQKGEIAPQMEDVGKEEDSVPNGTGVRQEFPDDPKKEFYAEVRRLCGKTSSGLGTILLKQYGGDVTRAMMILDAAATKHDPKEYIAAITRGDRSGRAEGVLAETTALYAGMAIL